MSCQYTVFSVFIGFFKLLFIFYYYYKKGRAGVGGELWWKKCWTRWSWCFFDVSYHSWIAVTLFVASELMSFMDTKPCSTHAHPSFDRNRNVEIHQHGRHNGKRWMVSTLEKKMMIFIVRYDNEQDDHETREVCRRVEGVGSRKTAKHRRQPCGSKLEVYDFQVVSAT